MMWLGAPPWLLKYIIYVILKPQMNADKRGYCMRNLRSFAVILSEYLPDLYGFLVQIRADQCIRQIRVPQYRHVSVWLCAECGAGKWSAVRGSAMAVEIYNL